MEGSNGYHGGAAQAAKRLQRLARDACQQAAQLERLAALPGDLLGTYTCAPGVAPDNIADWLQAVLPERGSSQELVITVIAR